MIITKYKNDYLTSLRSLNYSNKTIESYAQAIIRLNKWLGPNKRVQDITEKDMINYSVSMKEEGLKPHSISN